MRSVGGVLDAVDLPVGSHDAATGRRTDLDPFAQERRMHTVLTQQRILLELADLVSDVKRDFANPLVGLWPGI